MARFVLAGRADCPHLAKAEHLGEQLQGSLPFFRINKIFVPPEEWKAWLDDTCRARGWSHSESPLVWRELVHRGGRGMLLGGLADFLEHCQEYYGVVSDLTTDTMMELAAENRDTEEKREKELRLRASLLQPLHVWIGGALNPTCSVLIPHLLSEQLLPSPSSSSSSSSSSSRVVSLHLLHLHGEEEALHTLRVEAEELGLPLLHKVTVHVGPEEAFRHADLIILLDEEEVRHQEDQEEAAVGEEEQREEVREEEEERREEKVEEEREQVEEEEEEEEKEKVEEEREQVEEEREQVEREKVEEEREQVEEEREQVEEVGEEKVEEEREQVEEKEGEVLAERDLREEAGQEVGEEEEVMEKEAQETRVEEKRDEVEEQEEGSRTVMDEEEKEVLQSVSARYRRYGRLIGRGASPDVRVLVAGDAHLHLKCAALAESAPSVHPSRFVAVTTPLENAARACVAQKLGVATTDIQGVAVRGDLGGALGVDLRRARVFRPPGALQGPASFWRPALELLHDRDWLKAELPALVARRRASELGGKAAAAMTVAHGVLTVLRAWNGVSRAEEEGSPCTQGEEGL